jgi:hypothetical protein
MFDTGYQLHFAIELAVFACCRVQRADFTGFTCTDLISVVILHVFTLLSLMYPTVVFFFGGRHNCISDSSDYLFGDREAVGLRWLSWAPF